MSLSFPPITNLNVVSLTTAIAPVTGTDGISFTGIGSLPAGTGSDAVYYCSIAGGCTITTNSDPTSAGYLSQSCVLTGQGSSDNAACLKTIATVGPKGQSGPDLTLNYVYPGTANAFGVVTTNASGVFAQSLGSTGGRGGNAYVAGDGGNGGPGADGGTVVVNSSANVTTFGNLSAGVVAYSTGGRGGNGGGSYGIGGSGGDGGAGGYGGTASVYVYGGTITTWGDQSVGVAAISQGGQGGNGGGGGGIAFQSGGGSSAGAGNSALVSTAAGTSIVTHGDYSHGILAESIGGVGGGGGGSFGLFYSGGGSGGSGGDGGIATVTASGSIMTWGDNAMGILAESIGGGGGSAGTNAGLVALGDSGNTGGAGGTVSVSTASSGSIWTNGNSAVGLMAQSIGGGGGNGGSAGGLVGIGGSGSITSNGGDVTVDNLQMIATNGTFAQAIFAQSIGGGGGNGGTGVGLVSFGGSGGGGGNGGSVDVSNSATLSTTGSDSSALFAQSIGGGGGNGGNAYSGGLGVSLAIGGSAASGGRGGAVTVNGLLDLTNGPSSTIITTGDRSDGIEAQSIGGGGGNGGLAVSVAVGTSWSASVALGGSGGDGGNSGMVLAKELGTISTSGAQADGIFAQSIGGGGGNGGGSVAVSLSQGYSLGFSMGGTAGNGGSADTVTVDAGGSITTTGSLSYGVFAQSAGGGGGDGGFSVSAVGTEGPLAASIALGGSGGVGGNGSEVTVDLVNANAQGEIHTFGSGSTAIFAQSVGGGGGNGGFAVAAGVGGGAISVGLGGKGQSGGNGSVVSVTNADNLLTQGSMADGIFAQSVGGGGGNGGFAAAASGGVIGVSAAIGGKGAGGGNSGAVSVANSGAITTDGALSYGIDAQSVGGGGGNGGFALSGALGVQVDDIPGGAAAISVGGFAGGGGESDTVTIDNSGSIETEGLGSHAIFAQSIGGGGGTGGIAGSVGMTIGSGAAFGVAVGGFGGAGGDGQAVSVTSTGNSIVTLANGANGIFAQSIGGGGGDGGFAFTGALGFGDEENLNATVAIGGFGSDGGTASTVTVISSSAITTQGDNSVGIFAQSVGGGGGSGGLAVSGTLGLSETSGNVGVTIGGFAGNGSTSNNVSVTNSGSIATSGYDSIGILAQSIGGSGGNGGLALTAQLTGTTKESATVGVSIGGGAGSGNAAGTVDVDNLAGGLIATTGFGADGIKALSIGGGGGDGGMAMVAQVGVAGGTEEQATKTLNMGISVGGAGGSGGTGNSVEVSNVGAITVAGVSATGIFAQSIGGGGGDGGGSLDAIGMLTDSTNDSSRAVTVSVSVGGKGGTGNDAGTVTVDNSGAITTKGASGYGIFAQSIGGGGGIGGRANTMDLMVSDACSLPVLCTSPKSSKNNFQLGVTVGGNGGGSGNGNVVIVDNTGVIATSGDSADGIYAQSVGGGGGNGGNGILGSSQILPYPVEMAAIPVGSVSFYKNVQVVVGGNAGASGNGGTVSVEDSGAVTTQGDDSNGIFAQSIGGGGGIAGNAAIGATGTLGIGGKGGAAGNGGEVTVSQSGAKIETFGVASDGIFAQSVGGGGGVAGNVDRALSSSLSVPVVGYTVPALNLGIGLALGQGGGDGGNGGNISVSLLNQAQIITHGDNAAGIFAQSVGGGGGVLGDLGDDFPGVSLLSWHIGSNGDAGNAGTVTVNVAGTIKTSGDNATGILAQSAGGQGTGGDVNVTVTGSVLTGAILAAGDGTAANPLRGLGSAAIVAQSVGNAGNGNITVDINGANSVVEGGNTQLTGSGSIGVGIWLIDGNANTVINHGLVTTLGGVNAGYAILANGSGSNAYLPTFNVQNGGNNTVENFGTVTGSFDLGGGNNSFINEAGATLNTGRYATVGSLTAASNLLLNNGTLYVGGSGNVFTTTVLGNWKQNASGTYGVDLDLYQTDSAGNTIVGKTADRINVTGSGTGGGNANLSGTVSVNIMDPGNARPGSYNVTIVHADTGVTTSGLTLVAPPSAVASYQLTYPDSKSADLSYVINFDPAGLNINQSAFGAYLNKVQLTTSRATPSTAMAPLIAALFDLPSLSQYAGALNQLVPQVLTGNSIATEFSSLQFSDALMSCHVAGGDYKFVAENTCLWFRAAMRNIAQDNTTQLSGANETDEGLSLGGQEEVSPGLFVGLAASYDAGSSTFGNDSKANGTRYQAGASLKAQLGQAMLGFSLSGGAGRYDTMRQITFTGFGAEASGKENMSFIATHARASYAFDLGDFYLTPKFDLGMTRLMISPYTETGGSLAGLAVAGQNHTFVTMQPGLEFGWQFTSSDNTVVRPFGSVGLLASTAGGASDVSAALANAPAAAGTFKVSGRMTGPMLDNTIGLEIFKPSGLNVQLGASLQSSSDKRASSFWVKLALPM
ncbi:MAG: hypothetical protein WCA81_10195 [Rhizomicrobium sp.]